jgi:hypothetical protein
MTFVCDIPGIFSYLNSSIDARPAVPQLKTYATIPQIKCVPQTKYRTLKKASTYRENMLIQKATLQDF